MDNIDKLSELFLRFPGIGPRQAKRFVFFLLRQDKGYLSTFAKGITTLKDSIRTCTACFRYFQDDHTHNETCSICSSTSRDTHTLMIVEKDVDVEQLEKSHAYNGQYFVLGGTAPLIEESKNYIRKDALIKRVTLDLTNGLTEVILAMSATPEGDYTATYVKKLIHDIPGTDTLTISTLGRGLSTGIEIEYSDPDTIEHALKNRK